MSFGAAEFEGFADKYRGLLLHCAMTANRHCREDAQDIVQNVLLSTWQHREQIHSDLLTYATQSVKYMAWRWGKAKKLLPYCQLDELMELPHDKNPMLVDSRQNALEELCGACERDELAHRRDCLVGNLTEPMRKHYAELKARDFNPTDRANHAFEIRASRVKQALKQEFLRIAA